VPVDAVQIEAVPTPLRWLGEPRSWSAPDGRSLLLDAGPRTDLFVDPRGSAEPMLNAPALVGDQAGDYLLSARVTVGFADTYDAGVLLLYASERVWAKLCFEYSPQRQPMVVSVVTRDLSDDCNSFDVDGESVWLRIARLGPAFAFHASTDGSSWSFVRHFALEAGAEPSVGFSAQSPKGEGCAVAFEQIRFDAVRLGDLRSGE
jgi:regulation of enolase protein 1 (concanavalin A-like superfamily)